MPYEVVRRDGDKLEISKQKFTWRFAADRYAARLNSLDSKTGGIFEAFTGSGPRWVALPSRDVTRMLEDMKAAIDRADAPERTTGEIVLAMDEGLSTAPPARKSRKPRATSSALG